MKCELSHPRLHTYFDGEMSTPQATEFERHLADCADCISELADLNLLRRKLQTERFPEQVPASLRSNIRANFAFVARATGVSPPLLWHWLAAATALLSLAIVLWKVTPSLRTDEFAQEIVDAHLRSLQLGRLTGVVSNDEHVVKQWFESMLNFAVPVWDFANEGFALQSGRVAAVDGRPLAALMYVHDGHLISLFIWPARELDSAPHTGSQHGYQWVEWRKGRTDFCAVSDLSLNSADLRRLQGLIAE